MADTVAVMNAGGSSSWAHRGPLTSGPARYVANFLGQSNLLPGGPATWTATAGWSTARQVLARARQRCRPPARRGWSCRRPAEKIHLGRRVSRRRAARTASTAGRRRQLQRCLDAVPRPARRRPAG
jgi:ABC-type Fe3+/spermidine/putrescine transport system ATPase subunit